MEYKDVLKLLKDENIKKILLTGPERSGTRIHSKMLATDLKYNYIDEVHFGYYNMNAFKNLTAVKEPFIAQGPLMTPHLKDVPEDIAIIFMIRPIKDILASQDRIHEKRGGWEESQQRDRIKAALNNDPRINWDGRNPEIKYEIWEKIQKPTLPHKLIELDHGTTKDHPLWIKKDLRKDFDPHQTTIGGSTDYIL